MTLTQKLLVATGVAVLVVAVAWIGFLGFVTYVTNPESGTPSDMRSAIECTLEWGRLAPFPPSAEQFTITTHGTMFTRQFRTSFTAAPAEIERWLKDSPGIQEISPTVPSTGVRKFQIRPGGGAQHAEVLIDDAKHQVFIDVSWS
jgi:hypothetical protein